MTPKLHIGDKNYSSWSMRPWLALRVGGIVFDEVQHQLPEIGGKPSFGDLSPNARVPALDLGGGVVIASFQRFKDVTQHALALPGFLDALAQRIGRERLDEVTVQG